MAKRKHNRQVKMMLKQSEKPLLPKQPDSSKKSVNIEDSILNSTKENNNNNELPSTTQANEATKEAKKNDNEIKSEVGQVKKVNHDYFLNSLKGLVYHSSINIASLHTDLKGSVTHVLSLLKKNMKIEESAKEINVIVNGPRGNGKSYLIHAIAGELGLPILIINSSVLLNSTLSIETIMSEVFAHAKRIAPCILHINNCNLETESNSVYKADRKSDVLIYLNDNLRDICSKFKIYTFFEAISYASIDNKLKKIFPSVLSMGIPNGKEKLKILEKLKEPFKLAPNVNLNKIAFQKPGLVARDLKRLFQLAHKQAIYRMLESQKSFEGYLDGLKTKEVAITMEDLENILEDLVPSTLDQGYAAVPKISWDEVGALDKVKEVLKKLILRQVELAGQSEENMMQTSGILLYGPPGTGKTMIAKALANEANLNFLAIKGPELLNMYLGESERMLKECFERAQNSAPCVLFFDEIDTLCPARKDHRNDASSRLVGTMLTQMSGITPLSQVYLVATTNRPDSLDPALTRSGRFSTHLYVGLPNPEERYQILKTILSKRTTLLGPQLDLRDVAHKCHNYSGSDLHELVTQALNIHIACKQDISRLQLTDFQLSTLHFEAAMHLVKPSNSEDSLSFSKLSIPSDALQSEGSKKRKRESDGNSHLARPAKIPASVLQQEDAGMISLSQPNAELTQTDQFATIISQLAALSQSSSQPPGSLEPSQGIKETTVSEESLFSKYLFNKPPQSDEEYDPLIPNMPPDHELHLLDEKKLLKSSIHVSCCFSSMPFNKSILVHGPPGTGKRTFIRALGALNRVRVVEIDLKLRCNFNEIAFVKKLNRYYEQALAQAPCILYLNRLDYYEKNDAKIVCDALASFIERLETQDRDKHVMVAVSVRDTASLTPELLQACPDSFSLQHPTEIQCKKILESLDPDADVDFEELAKELPGVEYGDLLNLSNLAGQVKQGDRSTIEDYRSVLRLPHVKILPSKHEKPDISWGSVGGMEHVKKTLKLEILTRVKHRKVFEHLGMAGSSGIILCGPPGTGKTLVASVIASEAGLNFISVKGPELLNMYVGESERNIRECFAKAKSQAPCIICFDEIDSLCMRRQNSDEVMNRVVGTLLSELNGLHPRNQVFVIGTTNRFTSLDPAVLRTGRLGLHLYVDLPTPEERVQVLKAILSNLPTVKMHNEEDLVKIAHSEKCANFTGADLNELVSKVVMEQRYVSNSNPLLLSLSHFEEVLSSMKPSLKPQDLAQYLETHNLINRNMEYRRKLFELLPHKDGFLH